MRRLRSKLRLVSLVCGTAAVALSIGYVMQNALVTPQPGAAVQHGVTAPSAEGIVTRDALWNSPMDEIVEVKALPPAVQTPVLPQPERAPEPPSATEKGEIVAQLSDRPTESADGAEAAGACAIRADAAPLPNALVRLSVDAPCQGNARLMVHHAGMMFSETTDPDGRLEVVVPALTARAVFIVAFPEGRGTTALAEVAGLEGMDRVVLQWSGPAGFQLHAREFGAAYGSPGHVWSGNSAKDPEAPGGFVMRLGDAQTFQPRLAEVYTFPSARSGEDGTVTLTVEVEVTAESCGRPVTAEALKLTADGMLTSRDLRMAMPDCGAIGDFLVLNNLVDDLKIAAN